MTKGIKKDAPGIMPPALKKGDTIGIVAPASHFKEDPFLEGVSILENSGYRVLCHESIGSRKRYLAGEDEVRANMIMDFFLNPEVSAILCARGGYGTIRTLPYIDFDVIRANPKLISGFSDVSSLLVSIQQRAGLVAFHGPTATSLGKVSSETLEKMFQVFASPDKILLQARTELRGGKATGILTGGNLCTINHMLGTPFEPDFGGKIVILEDVGESPYKIDRMLTQMKQAGCFDETSGLILGTFENCGDYQEICEIAMEIFSDLEFPVLSGMGVGHGETNYMFPLGAEVLMDTGSLKVSAKPH